MHRRHTVAAAGVAGLLIAALVAVLLLRPSGGGGVVTLRAPGVLRSAPGASVGTDFLGLSFETTELPEVARDGGRGDLVALLSSLGPGVLRFGGTTADTKAAWRGGSAPVPTWATTAVTPGDLYALARLARNTGWRVVLTVNLGHYDPAAAADEVRVAHRALGSALLAVEIGNEPDAFAAHGLRPASWNIPAYLSQVRAYRRAITAAVPGVEFAGPDAVNPRRGRPWMLAEASQDHPLLLTVTYYPLGRCGSTVPTISDLLDPTLGPAESATLRRLRAVSRRTARPVRLQETNNVACGGQPGVSDTFASALWGLDYVVRAMAAGLNGVNLHGDFARPSGYAPLAPTGAQQRAAGLLQAKPEWYALLAASRLRGDRAAQGATQSPGGLRGSLTVLQRADGGQDVVVVNLSSPGDRAQLIRVPLPAGFQSGTVLRLQGPSFDARAGVTLGGASVTPAGTWRARLPLPPVLRQGGFAAASVPAASAAIITLRVRR